MVDSWWFCAAAIQDAIDIDMPRTAPKCRSRSSPGWANVAPAFVMVCGATML